MLSALVVLDAGDAQGLGRSRVGSRHGLRLRSNDGHLRPNLHNIKLFGVVTSYGSSWWIVRVFAGDAGRKVLMRGMKPLCAKDAQSFYLAHYGMDASTPASREAFLEKVRRRIARI